MENPQTPSDSEPSTRRTYSVAVADRRTNGRTDGKPALDVLDVGGSPPTFTRIRSSSLGRLRTVLEFVSRLLMWVGPPETMRVSLGRLRTVLAIVSRLRTWVGPKRLCVGIWAAYACAWASGPPTHVGGPPTQRCSDSHYTSTYKSPFHVAEQNSNGFFR